MLKAALAKATGGGSSAAPQESKIDNSSFPCIEEGKPLQDDVAASFAALELRQAVVGSMPTRTLSGGVRGRGARGDWGSRDLHRGCAMWAGHPGCAAAVQTLAGGWVAAAPAAHAADRLPACPLILPPCLPACRWIMTWRPAACGQPRKSSQPPWCAWASRRGAAVLPLAVTYTLQAVCAAGACPASAPPAP